MKIDLVGQNWVEAAWPHVAPRLHGFCRRFTPGKVTADDIRLACIEGRQQLWTAYDGGEVIGVCITEIVAYPQGRWGRIAHLTGERLSDWLMYLPDIEAWFREQGCVGAELNGRQEWRRVLRRQGYSGNETIGLERRFAA